MMRSSFKLSLATLSAIVLTSISSIADDPPAIKKGEKIVFLGDSITHFGERPKGYITAIKSKLNEKYKDQGIEIIGAGIIGNKVTDLQRRLEKDVLAKKPTLVVIYIGINDVWHGDKIVARGTTKEDFEAGLKEIIAKIQASGARVVLCTPSVIGEKKPGTNKLDAQLDEYAEISRKVAMESKSTLCDLRKTFQDYLAKNNADDKDLGVLTVDRAHLNDAGNKLVADTILSAIDR